jgi:hypothetical protein
MHWSQRRLCRKTGESLSFPKLYYSMPIKMFFIVKNHWDPYFTDHPRIKFVAWARKQTISTERTPPVSEVVPTFTNRGCHMISVTDLHGRILAFLDRSSYYFFQAAPKLYSRGWVDPVPDPPLLRKSGSAGNWTRTPGSVARNTDH